MNTFNIDGKKVDETYLKETFDLPVFNGDFEDIYNISVDFIQKL